MNNWYERSKEERQKADHEKELKEKLEKEYRELMESRRISARLLMNRIRQVVDKAHHETSHKFRVCPRKGPHEVVLETGGKNRPVIGIFTGKDDYKKILSYEIYEGHYDKITGKWKNSEIIRIKSESINPEAITEKDIIEWLGELVEEEQRQRRLREPFLRRIGCVSHVALNTLIIAISCGILLLLD